MLPQCHILDIVATSFIGGAGQNASQSTECALAGVRPSGLPTSSTTKPFLANAAAIPSHRALIVEILDPCRHADFHVSARWAPNARLGTHRHTTPNLVRHRARGCSTGAAPGMSKAEGAAVSAENPLRGD